MLKNRFKKILVSLDGSMNSIRGLNEAISLARQCDSTITGIHVLPYFSRTVARQSRVYREYRQRQAQKFLKKAKLSASRHGIEFKEKLTTSDNKIQTITGYAKKNKFDIIIIGSRGQGSPRSSFLGSVAHGVVNSSRIPVLVVK